jgi:integrase
MLRCHHEATRHNRNILLPECYPEIKGLEMAKLTAAAVEKIKPAAHRREVPDSLLRGLYLVVQPSGKKSWACRYRTHAGKTRKLTLGPYPAIDLKQARDQGSKALLHAAAGADPAVEKRVARRKAAEGADTFGRIALEFIEKYQKPRNRTWKQAAWYLGFIPDPDDPDRLVVADDGLVDQWGDRKIDSITKADIIAAIDRDSVVENRRLAVLSKLFHWAMSRDLLTVSPTMGVTKPVAEKARARVLCHDELCAIWTATEWLSWPFAPIIYLLILTGARRSEVAEMKWSELDLERRVWTLPGARSKNGIEHQVPLSPQAIGIIEKLPHRQNTDFVFTVTGRTPPSGFSKIKERLDARSGVVDWTVHDLRRTLATGLQRLGTRLEVTEAVLGHVSGSRRGVVGIYQRHSWSDEKRAALEVWGRYVENLISPVPANVTPLRGKVGVISASAGA